VIAWLVSHHFKTEPWKKHKPSPQGSFQKLEEVDSGEAKNTSDRTSSEDNLKIVQHFRMKS